MGGPRKPFPEYVAGKFEPGSKEHAYFWQGVNAGGDMAKSEVQWLIDQYESENKPVPYELRQVMMALKDAFEDK